MSLRRQSNNLNRIGAAAAHALTASGGVIGLFALISASRADWPGAFSWLGAALIVDGADGPLARRFEADKTLPRFSGEDLDKIVDYLNYVTVPAFIVALGPIVPDGLRLFLAAAIMLVSLYHFADKKSKTAEGYFKGFPAVWNIAVFYCYAMGMPPAANGAILGLCAFLTFVPFRWLHPLRVRRWRPVTLLVLIAGSAAAVATLLHGFPGNAAERLILALAAAYMMAAGLTATQSDAAG